MSRAGPRFDRHPYGLVAGFYDELAGFYSRGRIEHSKLHGISTLSPGERVLFAGVGGGRDALAAARRGVRVTALDLSPRMLRLAAERFASAGLEAQWIEGDVAAHRPAVSYDAVVAHYFLNLWDREQAGAMAAHLASIVRPGGRLIVADFARPAGGAVARMLAYAYYGPVDVVAWMLGLCALHPILDYRKILPAAGWVIDAEERLPVFGCVDPAFVSIRATRA